jgi:polysaccharide chain length determinant protein (PEP-CTERM system associated)
MLHDLLLQLLTYAHGMWRYRWYALLVAWTVCVGGWMFVYSLPDEYEAKARVYLDTQSVLRPLLRGLAIESDVDSRVKLMTRALLSRPNLEKVARATDLDLRAKTPVQMDALISGLQRAITIRSDRRKADLYEIRYTDRDPEMAQKVVQKVVTTLVEETLGSSRTDTAIAQRFLDGQIRDYEARLTEAEQRLADFKKRHVGSMPSEGRGYYTRLQAAMEQLEQTRAAVRVAENRRGELRKQLQTEEVNLVPMGPSDIETRIQDRQKELDALMLKYTDQHPDVLVLRETIAQLKARSDAETAEAKKDRERARELSPVYQAVKIELSKAEVELASLNTQMTDQQRKVNELRKRVDTIPEVEAELARLNRDYNITKVQYESLVKRRESARLSEQAEQKSDDIKFRIIDPPTLPRKPSAPDRFILLTMVLLGALGAGVGLAFVLNELRPVFLNARVLREITGLPVLGSVSMKLMPKEKLKLRFQLAFFVLISLGLLATYGGALLFEDKGVHLTQTLLRMV